MHKGKLRVIEGNSIGFWCEGCKCHHVLNLDKTKSPNWDFNADYNNPTIRPSIHINFNGITCHSFVTDGKIQYLGDSTHELAGKTVELKEE